MANFWWELISGVFALLVFGFGVRSYERLMDFVWVAVGFMIASLALNFMILRFRGSGRETYVLLIPPILFFVGLFGSLAAVSSPVLKIFLAAGGALLLYLYEIRLKATLSVYPVRELARGITPPARMGKTHHAASRVRNFISNAASREAFSNGVYEEDLFSLTAAFLVFVFLWALNFFFTPPAWILSILFFAVSFGFFWPAVYGARPLMRESILWAMVCALILVEAAWSLMFWPVHFLTAAAASFAVFYMMYILSRLYLHGRLSRKKIYFQTAIIAVVLLLSLLSSPWQPIK